MQPEKEPASDWITEVIAGNEDAARELWDRYFPELLNVARKHLRTIPKRIADEEDVALSALNSFFSAAQKGRFPNLAGETSLWRLLSRMTQRKAINLLRRHLSQKRGGDGVVGESRLQALSSATPGLDNLASSELGPELTAIFAEQCTNLMDSLGDEQLRQIAFAKLEGYTNREIASNLDLALRTVERRLELIRITWEQHS